MLWFEKIMGFAEESPAQVRRLIVCEGEKIRSLKNNKTYHFGRLEMPTLAQLQQAEPPQVAPLQIAQIVADVQQLHADPANQNAMFQAASQFNLLEMINPDTTPEAGLGIYQYDRTQGPACAIACGAGTIYRNYFVPLDDQVGQTAHLQIDCLSDMRTYFGGDFWTMRNGYALPNAHQLAALHDKITSLNPQQRRAAKNTLRIGLQSDTQVTLDGCQHRVSQAYCSALPIAYANLPQKAWEPWARLILEASYEATFWAAIRNMQTTQNPKLFLTLVGGGAFGNPNDWIFEALRHALNYFKNTGLQVYFVSYGQKNAALDAFISSLQI